MKSEPSVLNRYESIPLQQDSLLVLLRSCRTSFSHKTDHPVILCIGTDRLIGDSLGPITGSFLLQRGCTCPVYGTLTQPVHALNLDVQSAAIRKYHPNSPILAIDASLGPGTMVGALSLHPCGLKPGSGVHKQLPHIGDLSITGITNSESLHPYLALQTARLSTVIKMAEEICSCILSCLL